MQIVSAKFISSAPSLKFCPAPSLAEFAFIGRSNVGKSSLINAVAGRKGLAKVSGTPGKTRLINHFLVNDAWYLVDLPGYGFARISREERTRLERMIEGYLLRRETLRMVFVLVDIRHDPQRIDLEFMAWLQRNRLPFTILFTKSDKISKGQAAGLAAAYRNHLLSVMNLDPGSVLTSSVKKEGKEEILTIIENRMQD